MTKPPLLILLFCLTLPGFPQPGTTTYGKEKGSALQGTAFTSKLKMDRFAGAEAAGKETLDSIYAVRTATEHSFINGTEYFPYHYRAKHKPLLQYGVDRSAEIIVSGRKYDGLVLQYDTYTDEVIFSEMDNDFGNNLYHISLKRDLIGGFILFFRTDTLRFRYFNAEETAADMTAGFYEVAYEGPTDYIIRHRSVVHQRNGIDEYYYSPVGYIKTTLGYKKITSGSKFYKLFGEGSEEIKKMVEQQGIKLRRAGKREIIRLLQAYDNRTGGKK
ncbi:hypothetical protein EG830_14595 [bacterium]|nr:hypothetical protein [bacterium]